MNLSGYSKFFELIYFDRMDITTSVEVIADDITNNVYPDEPQQIDIPCRISFSGVDRPNDSQEEAREPIHLGPTIFCNTSVNVRAGDRLAIRRRHSNGSVYATISGKAILSGEPNRWENHQEIGLDISGDA